VGRALWIAFAAIFTSLLLYLAIVGHREQVARLTSAVPDVLGGLTRLVDRISLPGKDHPSVGEADSATRNQPKTEVQKPDQTVNIDVSPQSVSSTPVALSNVEYASDGQLVLVGKAPSGARLDFSIDGVKVEQTSLASNGEWKLAVPGEVSSGPHRLEVSLPARSGRPKTIIVLPFVKAGPEEIAALTAALKTAETGNVQPRVVARKSPGENDTAEVPVTVQVPNRKSPPTFSKLAELARSQSVKSDVDPLARLLPRLMIGDGPSLATPEVSQTRKAAPKPDVVPRRQTLERIKPVLKQLANQPELVVPRPQNNPQVPNKTPAQSEVAVASKSEPVVDAKEIENRPVVNKKAKKVPYTGNRKVTVSPGKGLVVVQPGNTLWDLAISIYGSSRYYQKLYRANRAKIKNPQMIFPGQIIFAPDADPPTSIEPASPPQWSPPQ